MVYRITGVYRRRIDEIHPYFPDAEIVDEAEETVLRLVGRDPRDASVEVRAQPPGFYIHWWTAHPAADRALTVAGIEGQELRDIVFTRIGRWTEELYHRERHVDFSRKTGALTVEHYHLFPYAADPALSARVIADGLVDVVADRERVEAILRDRLSALAAERAAAPPGGSPAPGPRNREPGTRNPPA